MRFTWFNEFKKENNCEPFRLTPAINCENMMQAIQIAEATLTLHCGAIKDTSNE